MANRPSTRLPHRTRRLAQSARRRSTRFRTLAWQVLEERRVLAGDLWHAVFAPGTSVEYMESFEDSRAGNSLPQGVDAFQLTNRWTTTATDGSGLGQGDPTTLTWSIVDDGTSMPVDAGESSNLVSFLRGIYGVASSDSVYDDADDAPWFSHFQSVFDRWAELTGITFVYEPNDDGAALPSLDGLLGTRGDIRIGGHPIDGDFNTLAYNYYPNGGDMVIDTADDFYSNTANNSRGLRNTLAHEIGHGIGLRHVESSNAAFLMEPTINLSFDGPQFDDILGAQRHYGDAAGDNGTAASATDLNTLSFGIPITVGGDANDTVVAVSEADFVSIDSDSEQDVYAFDVTAPADLTITLTPRGPTYLEGAQGGSQTSLNTALRNDLTLEVLDSDGVTSLAIANVNPAGVAEVLTYLLPSSGTYYARVSGANDAAQMYELNLSASAAIAVDVVGFSAATYQAVEETAATNVMTLNRTGDVSEASQVQVSIIGGTASAGAGIFTDYAAGAFPLTVSFAAGETSKTIPLTIFEDPWDEATETVLFEVTAVSNATIGTQNTTTFEIIDDDDPLLGVIIEKDVMPENGGSSPALLQRNSTSGDLVVTLTSSDASEATTPATVTIPDGEYEVSFTVTAVDDAIEDGVQTATITPSAAGYANVITDSIAVTDNEAPGLAPGNLLVTTFLNSDTDQISEYTLAGQLVRVSTVPHGADTQIRDIVVDEDLYVHAYSGTFSPELTTIRLSTETTTTQTLSGWSTDGNVSYGGLAALRDFIFATDMGTSGGAEDGIVRFHRTAAVPPERFGLGGEFTDLSIGHDGLLYALDSTSATDFVHVFDPYSKTRLRLITLPSGPDHRGITADAAGNMFLTTWTGEIHQYSPAANLLKTLDVGSYRLMDIDLRADGTLVVGSWDTRVFVTDLTLAAYTSFPVSSQTGPATFVAFTDPLQFSAAALTVSISKAEISENGGTAQAVVTRTSAPDSPLTVTLTSSDPDQAVPVPTQVTFAAGQVSAVFDLNGVNESLVDGTQTLTITASAVGHASGSATINVTDDDTGVLTLTIHRDAILENAGPGAATATVTRSSNTGNALTVMVSSSDPNEVTPVSPVTIPIGESSVTFALDAVDDLILDGTKRVTITATAVNHTTASDTLDVRDDEAALRVDRNSTATVPDGLSWGTAFPTLQAALSAAATRNNPSDGNLANDVTAIWVADGIYTPGTERWQGFQLVSNVAVYGGFQGIGASVVENSTDDRGRNGSGRLLYETVLSGDLAGNDDPHLTLSQLLLHSTRLDNAYRVVSAGAATGARLDGLTITGGSAANYVDNGSSSYVQTYDGGGILSSGSSNAHADLTLNEVLITGNAAGGSGGGIAGSYAHFTITNSTIAGNTAGNGGGIGDAIYNISGLHIYNSIVAGNVASVGGGISTQHDLTTITNSMVVDNVAYYGGGFGKTNGGNNFTGNILAVNTLIARNDAATHPDTAAPFTPGSNYNLVGVWTGNSPIGANSLYRTAAAPLDPGISDWTLRDDGAWGYYLLPGSPALDAGDSSAAVGPDGDPLTDDLYNNPRQVGVAVDIGAIEGAGNATPGVSYVVTSLANTIAPDGVLTLAEAFQAANTNQPAGDAAAGSFADRDVITFAGGLGGSFALAGAPLSVHGDLEIDGSGAAVTLEADQVDLSQVLEVRPTANVELIDLELAGGTSDSPTSHRREVDGGAITNYRDLVLRRVTIADNYTAAWGRGGGVYNFGDLSVIDSTIEDNAARQGGGIYSIGKLTVSGSLFAGNSAASNGGGLNVALNATLVEDSTFQGNTAFMGAGIYNASSPTTIRNSVLTENVAGVRGGGYYHNSNQSIIVGSTVSHNRADHESFTSEGGGIYADHDNIRVVQSSVLGNAADRGGGIAIGGSIAPSGSLNVIQSQVVGNTATLNGGGIQVGGVNNRGSVQNSTIAGNVAASGGGINVSSGGLNLIVVNSIVAKNTATADDYDDVTPFSTAVSTSQSWNNLFGVGYDATGTLDGKKGHIVGTPSAPMDPRFTRNPSDGGDGWGDDPATASVDESANDDFGDLTPLPTSPAVNAGDQSRLPADTYDLDGDADVTEVLPIDLAGAVRVQTGELEIGSYEVALSSSPPTDIALDNLTVNEDTAGAVVGTVAVTDPDVGDTHVLSVSDNRFEIVGGQLKLKETESVDFQAEPSIFVIITAVDSAGLSRRESFTIQVLNLNEVPVLNPIGDRTVAELATLSFTITATDADLPAQPLTYSATGLPAGAAFDPATRQFSWTPTEAQGPGTYNVTFTVSDGNDEDSETIVITVTEMNVAPELDSIGNQTVAELAALDFTIVGNDADLPGQTLTYIATNLPAGATLNTATGDFSWTPAENQDGVHQMTFTVSDGSLTDSETITITVGEVNLAPELDAIGNKSVAEESALMFTIDASDADVPVQTLTYSVTGLPAGAEFDPATRQFSWTPAENQDGVHQVTFTVSDGSLSDSETITITVGEENVAPVLAAIGDKSVAEETALTFTISASDADEPVQTLVYNAAGLPAGASFDPVTRQFSWTPTEVQGPGSYDVTFTVSDSILTDSETITITVGEVNVAPELDSIGNQTVAEMVALNFTVIGNDADLPGQTLTYNATNLPAGATLNTATGDFSWTPAENQDGVHQMTFTVSDGSLIDSETITITVGEVNVAPALDLIGNQTVDELVSLNFTVIGNDADLPGQTLTYSAAGLPAGATLNTATGEFSWTPAENQDGVHQVTFAVSDGSLSDSETITITVGEVNVAPELAVIGNKSVAEETTLTFTIDATDADVPSQMLVYSAAGLPVGAVFDPATRQFSWTPTEAQGPGSYDVTFSVSDGSLSDSETITVTVSEVNIAPELDVIGDRSVAELTELKFTVSASDDGLPSNSLTYLAADLPDGATFNPATREFSWVPTEAQGPGSYEVTFTVSDGELSDSETITITVGEVNVAPELAAIGNKSVAEETALTFTIAASDADEPVQTLDYSATNLPAGSAFDPTTRQFSWTPTEGQGPASYDVTFSVGDGNLSDSETITITVGEVNLAPELAPIGNRSVAEETTLTFTISASDADEPVQTLVYNAAGLPAGASFDPATRQFSWTPTEAQGPGSYDVKFSVSDGSLTDSETITITVGEVNVAPALDLIGNRTVAEMVALNFTIAGNDADVPTQTLTYGATGLPAGATFHTATGEFNWTPAENQDGVHEVTFTVSDGSLIDSETITITVGEVNVAPVASDDAYEVLADTQLIVVAPGLLANDSDADTGANARNSFDPLVVSNPAHGSLVLNADGSFTYTPDAGFLGVDEFTYRVSDGDLESNIATVQITVAENDGPLHLVIDVKPGDFPNVINLRSNGKIPVAVLSTADFNAPREIDLASLNFGHTGDENSLDRRGNGKPNCGSEDVNGDGRKDLVCQFETSQAEFQTDSTEAILTGRLLDGSAFEGRDSVRIIGGRNGGDDSRDDVRDERDGEGRKGNDRDREDGRASLLWARDDSNFAWEGNAFDCDAFWDDEPDQGSLFDILDEIVEEIAAERERGSQAKDRKSKK